jgi:hypothetical protein
MVKSLTRGAWSSQLVLLVILWFSVGCGRALIGQGVGRPEQLESRPVVSPTAFWFDYEYEPRGKRLWSKESQGIWVERYPTGQTTRFELMGTGTVDGNSGVIVRRLPDEVMEVFIPDIYATGTNPEWLRFRLNLDGKWNYLAEVHFDNGK